MNSRRKEWSETWRQERGNAGLRQSVTVKQRDRELDIHLWDSVVNKPGLVSALEMLTVWRSGEE